jgi:hypothetical protein
MGDLRGGNAIPAWTTRITEALRSKRRKKVNMYNKQVLNSMVGALSGATFGGLLMGLPGALLLGIGTGLSVYLFGIFRKDKIS